MRKVILIFGSLLIILSCSSELDKKYSDDTFLLDAKEIKNSGNLNKEDIELLGKWIIKSKFRGDDLSQKTYGEILDEAKKVKKEKEAVVVSIFDKGFAKADYESYNSFSYIIKNKTGKSLLHTQAIKKCL